MWTTLATAPVAPIPGWFAILPALIAIVVALTLRQVIAALFLGIWLGAALVYGSIAGVWFGLLDVITDYVRNAVTDSGHGAIILFTLMVGRDHLEERRHRRHRERRHRLGAHAASRSAGHWRARGGHLL
jgi:hypothetical protein